MDTYININKIISITIADKREYIQPPFYVKVYSKGEPKYKINFTILFGISIISRVKKFMRKMYFVHVLTIQNTQDQNLIKNLRMMTYYSFKT